VVVADLDSADLTQLFAGQRYDRIVLADVLEHLKNPERILQQCHQLLQAGGQLLTSVPNVAYCGLLAELLQGEFKYRPEGLLDNTHLRFFTRQSLHRFFAQHGWQVKTSQTTTRDVLSSEFKGQFDLLPPAVSRHLLALPDASTYQFISCLEPAPAGQATADNSRPAATPALPLFSTQLYLAVDGQYDESLKLVTAGVMGGDTQTLRFEIPALAQGRYTHVRLDPADRPGFMRLESLSLTSGLSSGPDSSPEISTLWAWASTTSSPTVLEQAPQQHMVWSPPWGPSNTAWLQLHGDDPWIELPLPEHALKALTQHGGQLAMLAGWPMSADYIQANQKMQTMLAQQDRQSQQHQAELGQQNKRQQELQNELQTALQTQSFQAQSLRNLALEKAGLAQNMATAHQQLQAVQQQLGRIENSKLYRWTRPLAHFKYSLDGLLGRRPIPSDMSSAMPNQMPTSALSHNALPSPSAPVDVIVPVYRGLEDTQRCILSALASPCQTAWHLVVINDCSPEPEVSQWLREIAAQEHRITLLENEENLGFVATVNRGMRLHPDRDVLLLNSDTEVANDWLDRIQRAAYSRPQVASVTPFSNNATICSYPRFCEGNDLPAGWTTAQLDLLCAQHLAGQTVEVPTGIGFCMYIRRACLDLVGLFDVENFGKGYGEENDFCVRAENAGWVNLHNLDTFVRHAGGVSFGDSKSEREMLAMQTIRRLHPQYERDVQNFVQRDPTRQARMTLDLARLTCGKRIVILNVIHNRAGGSVRHLDDMAQAFAEQSLFLTLTPLNGGLSLHMQGPQEAFRLQWPSLEDAHWQHLLQTLRQLRVAHVHYHHLMGHGPLVAQLHQHLAVSHDFTAHDYFSYCPQITLTDEEDRYCGEKGLSQCQQCVKQRPAPGGLDIIEWRARSQPLLNTARYVLAPSQDTQRRMMAFAPTARVVYAPHLLQQTAPAQPVANPANDRPLKVVVLGALSKIKGADTLEAVASMARQQQAPVEFHLLGYGYRSLKTQPRANLTVHGSYQEKDLPDLLKWLDADMAWFPAQCPETYSYTLSACLAAGLPVMASDLGAFSERLYKRPLSWLVNWQSTPQQWLDQILYAGSQLQNPQVLTATETSPAERQLASEPFDYRADYLCSLVSNEPLPTDRLPILLQQLTQATPTAPSGHQSWLLKFFYSLRNHPLLAPLVKRIPSHVQRRLKNRILNS
jgi:GT2 family glycosyltransferase/glycosyltransferase involved in cell wall biosynthesis